MYTKHQYNYFQRVNFTEPSPLAIDNFRRFFFKFNDISTKFSVVIENWVGYTELFMLFAAMDAGQSDTA